MNTKLPIENFPPGEFIREELEARGWTQDVLAAVLGRSLRLVNEIIKGRRAITPETARALGEAFGTSAELWMNLESAYQLGRVRPGDDTIARRAQLYSKAPIKEMLRRHWIEASDNAGVLEQRVLAFFEISSLEETPRLFPHAARKSTSYEIATAAQCSWLFRAKKLAQAVSAGPFAEGRLREGLPRLRALLGSAEDTRQVPRVLAELGVRLVLLESLPGTRIDGAAFWLGPQSPAIVLSMRYDRIDCFWHTLMHDLMHILHKDVKDVTMDVDLVGEHVPAASERPAGERRADADASAFLVDPAELNDFIARVRPLYSKVRLAAFAKRLGIHQGIVVGQLQHRGEIPFYHSREMLEKVREIVAQAALTDGWGHTLPASL